MTALGLAVLVSTANVQAAAPPDDFHSDTARSRYEAGVANFDAGDYEGALVELDASLEIEVQVRTLYAKAQSLNKLGRCRDAVPIYNRVLEMLPDKSPAGPAVKDALVICAEQMAAEDESASEGVEVDSEVADQDEHPMREDPQARKTWYRDPYAPVMLGLGAVGVGLGGYFLAEGAKLDPDAAPSYGEFEIIRDRKRNFQIQGGVIAGVGGALVLGGAIRYIVLATRDRRRVSSGQVSRVRLDGLGFGTVRVRF